MVLSLLNFRISKYVCTTSWGCLLHLWTCLYGRSDKGAMPKVWWKNAHRLRHWEKEGTWQRNQYFAWGHSGTWILNEWKVGWTQGYWVNQQK